MSFEEEWAGFKADALTRQPDSVQMRLNRAPAGETRGDGDVPAGGAGFSINARSVNGSSHLLLEIAGLLYEGRMDGENATQCRVPRAHGDVAASVDTFARFAKDQYNDMVVLLASLSTKLKSAGNEHTAVDHGVQAQMNSMVDRGRYVAPESR
ncbi:hypothetical protein [Streptomyces sp. NPDC002467]|uniref:hypothetical protein n=1 Tax=Streptomyces sp. NPDC002467 TaxID=3364647 RepID=UPI0036C3C96F